MPNQYVNKVVQSNGTTIIDISDTTAVASDVASGKYFYLATGEKVAGTASGGGDEPVEPTETLLGNTPYTLLEDANIKLVGDGSYTYSYTGTIADFEDRQNVTGTGAILTDEGSYYQLINNNASAWYQALIQMSFDGLTVGSSYTVTVSGTGDGTTSTSGYWVIRDAGGDTTYGTINPLTGTPSLTFEATTTSINVMLGCADSASWDNGIRTAKFTNMVITGAVEGSGSGEVALGQLTTGTQITSSPSVEVYAIIESSGTLRGKTCVCLGDSITALMAPPNDYPSVLASNTGMTVINGGFEGCRMSDTHPSATYAAFSAVKLADAIATGTWTTQDANISGFESGSYAPAHLTALKAVNWSNVDYITVEFGGNDAGDQYVYIDNTQNPTNTTTYVGAARYVYNRIHTAYPNIKIMFFVPMYRYWISEGKDSNEMTFTLGGNTYHYYDWGDALIASPPASGVPVIDMYRTLGINATNRQTYLLTSDQIHPSVAGCELIAQKFETELYNHFISGDSSATLITKTITANGTYSASSDSADGYTSVTVNVTNQDYEGALAALGVQSDLADSIGALTTYANSVTGEFDTTLSDAVASLASGYGGYSVRDIFMGAAPSGASVVFEPDAFVPSYGISGRRNITKLTIDASGLPSATQYGGFDGYSVSNNFIPYIHIIGTGSGTVQSYACSYNGNANNPVTVVCRGFTGVEGSGFRSNKGLKVIDLTFTGNFKGDATFRDCTILDTIIIRNSAVPALASVGAFTNTPFASGKAGGTIYVPSALINSYKAANNWKTVNGYGTITWAAIEGSQYANAYADGTPISA